MLAAIAGIFIVLGLFLVLVGTTSGGGYGPPTDMVFALGVIVLIMGSILAIMTATGNRGEKEEAVNV
jgi:hypothetical protein